MSHRELEQRRKEATPRGIGVLCDFYAVRAENATLWDEQGGNISILRRVLRHSISDTATRK